ncbi:MAG: UDP-glucose 4-epimerase GalE [Candidatus Ozemobacteraceae bacterium]
MSSEKASPDPIQPVALEPVQEAQPVKSVRPVVLVTGGAGYIGSHACKILASAGFAPVVYDNLVYGHREDVKWGPFVEGALEDRVRLDETFRKYRPAAVMHFAAYAFVGESVTDPAKYYRNNVVGSLTLLEAMRDHGVKHLVFSSTCATYGEPQTIPIPDDHPQHPINPYGTTKLVMERMMADFSVAYGLNWLALRYFNAAGADPDAEIGERHDPETHLIPLVLDSALGRRPHITVFGTDYATPDGTCIRDYIHVNDLSDAHVLALRYLQDGGASGGLNLGNGAGYSVKEVIETAERVTGRNIPTEFGKRRAGDPPRLVGDASRARSILGWKPRFADLHVIIEHAWKHRRKAFG